MKKQILLMAIIAMLVGTFSSCNRDGVIGDYPVLYVVNGSDYSAKVYCDNYLVATAGAHNNSGKVALSNTSVNLPVYVEAVFYDKTVVELAVISGTTIISDGISHTR